MATLVEGKRQRMLLTSRTFQIWQTVTKKHMPVGVVDELIPRWTRALPEPRPNVLTWGTVPSPVEEAKGEGS